MSQNQKYPPNNEHEGPYSRFFLASYYMYPDRYWNYEPHQLDPMQKSKISLILNDCQEIINRMNRCRRLPHRAKMKKTFQILDLMRKLRAIDNTHAFLIEFNTLFEEWANCTIFRYGKTKYNFGEPVTERNEVEREEEDNQEEVAQNAEPVEENEALANN